MQHNQHGEHRSENHYLRLAAMIVLSFISMYVLMYAMVNTFDDVYNSVNQVYMAGLMTAPMLVIELAMMASMYPNRRLNIALIAAGILALIVLWVFVRQQTAVQDKQFLRSMIPHHAGAILMCRQAPVRDAEIRDLCKSIVSGQQREIDQMRSILGRLDRQD